MPIEWPEKLKQYSNVRDWGNLPYEQRMKRIRWFALSWAIAIK